jgi:hypothetical protein
LIIIHNILINFIISYSFFNSEDGLDDNLQNHNRVNRTEEQTLERNMELQDTNFTDSPEWLRSWWIQQEAERERLQNLDSTYPGGPLPDPPIRPPKRPELRVDISNNTRVQY